MSELRVSPPPPPSGPRQINMTLNVKVEDIEPVKETLAIALECIAANQQTFAIYEAHHRDKGTPEGDYKADFNADHAHRCANAMHKIYALWARKATHD